MGKTGLQLAALYLSKPKPGWLRDVADDQQNQHQATFSGKPESCRFQAAATVAMIAARLQSLDPLMFSESACLRWLGGVLGLFGTAILAACIGGAFQGPCGASPIMPMGLGT